MSDLSASIEPRVVGDPKGALRPHVVIRFGTAEVAAWRVPGGDLGPGVDLQVYADRIAADKLRAVFELEAVQCMCCTCP